MLSAEKFKVPIPKGIGILINKVFVLQFTIPNSVDELFETYKVLLEATYCILEGSVNVINPKDVLVAQSIMYKLFESTSVI